MSGRETSETKKEGETTEKVAEATSSKTGSSSANKNNTSPGNNKPDKNDKTVSSGCENNASDRSSPSPQQTQQQKAQLPSTRSSPSPSSSPLSLPDSGTKNNNMNANSSNPHPARPPSATSVHSNNSGGPRTTATSRRGGRTRSRSPQGMSSRGSITAGGAASPAFTVTTNTLESSGGDSNPSSAAAAAAAAAKALSKSNNPERQGAWPDHHHHQHRGGPYHHRDDRHRDSEHSKYPAYDGHFQAASSRSWHADQDTLHGRPRRSGSYGHSQSIHRLPGGSGSGDLYGRHGPAGSYGSGDPFRLEGGRSGSMHPSYDEHADDRRWKGARSMSPTLDRYGQPYYGGSSRGPFSVGVAPADGRSSPKIAALGGSSRSGSGGMSRVIGTATPIHVPRASEAPPSRHSRSGTPASVFRGRPGSDGPRRDGNGSEEDTPQKILLSLRTPTTSFDEKQPAKARKDGDLPPSPDEPPQIQNSHHQHGSDFFEPSRSPKPGSIEMAPSFNLFNQSFDSFGDTFNVVGNLEASLQSASFGAGPTGSGDFGATGSVQALQPSLSGGNYTQQLLGSSGSGALTFGMSPVNSFGNGPAPPASSRRGSGNMMVLGGHDHRAASPTQVLGMYHSYSGGASHSILRPNNSMGPLDDRDLRLSASSFGGAPSLSHNYTRSFGAENSPIMSYGGRMGHSHDAGEGGQLFYIFLRKQKAAFKECTFLLPGLKAALLEAPLAGAKSGELGDGNDPMMKRSMSRGGVYPDPSPQDIAVARRRVTSAICAFGGTQTSDHSQQASSHGQSIFREKKETPTVTPSSSTGSPPGSRSHAHARAKAKYEEVLPTRYYENENRLSWEFEENPPVEAHVADEEPVVKSDSSKKPEDASSNEASQGIGEDGDADDKTMKAEDSSNPPTPSTPSKSGGDNEDTAGDSVTSPSGEQPKMRYRCKLCGQPKQNHTCPFMQSLARSIGVMVYPSVNAFTAAEPGIVAPPLSEMNNFVMHDDCSVADSKASIPSPDRRHLTGPGQNGSTQVTPESRRSKSRQLNSPSSTLSAGSATPQRPRTPGSASRNRSSSSVAMNPRTPGSSSRRSRKRRHGQMHGSPSENDQGDLLFVEPMELKPEQFKMVTPSKSSNAPDAYTYPALPLPYAQRKRLSDNLFSLSQKIPQLTKECSAVLREAREKDMWDLAVAELMTQVVVVIHCHDGDSRFDGLRQYLLTLGIAC